MYIITISAPIFLLYWRSWCFKTRGNFFMGKNVYMEALFIFMIYD